MHRRGSIRGLYLHLGRIRSGSNNSLGLTFFSQKKTVKVVQLTVNNFLDFMRTLSLRNHIWQKLLKLMCTYIILENYNHKETKIVVHLCLFLTQTVVISNAFHLWPKKSNAFHLKYIPFILSIFLRTSLTFRLWYICRVIMHISRDH